MDFVTRSVRVGAAAVAAIAVVLAAGAAQAELVPHRAVYDLKLDRADEGGSVTSFNGRMVIDIVASGCEGLATNSRYVFRSANATGATLLTDLRTAQWESSDGSSFRFVIRRYDNSELTEETDGEASRGDDGLAVALVAPKTRTVRFDGDVLFPTQHLNRLIAAARADRRTLSATVYEGADPGDQLYDTFAVIGQRIVPDSQRREVSAPGGEVLKDLDRWPVTVSYFPGEGSAPDFREDTGGEEMPVYAISSELFENGVSRKLLLDYGDFSLRGELTDITFLQSPDCD